MDVVRNSSSELDLSINQHIDSIDSQTTDLTDSGNIPSKNKLRIDLAFLLMIICSILFIGFLCIFIRGYFNPYKNINEILKDSEKSIFVRLMNLYNAHIIDDFNIGKKINMCSSDNLSISSYDNDSNIYTKNIIDNDYKLFYSLADKTRFEIYVLLLVFSYLFGIIIEQSYTLKLILNVTFYCVLTRYINPFITNRTKFIFYDFCYHMTAVNAFIHGHYRYKLKDYGCMKLFGHVIISLLHMLLVIFLEILWLNHINIINKLYIIVIQVCTLLITCYLYKIYFIKIKYNSIWSIYYILNGCIIGVTNFIWSFDIKKIYRQISNQNIYEEMDIWYKMIDNYKNTINIEDINQINGVL